MPPRPDDTGRLYVFLLGVRAFFRRLVPRLLQTHVRLDLTASGFFTNQTRHITRVIDLDLGVASGHKSSIP